MIFHSMIRGFCRCDVWLVPHQPIVSIIAGPLNPPILGDFEAFLARKSPRIRPFGHRRKGGWGAVRQGLLHHFLDLAKKL
jgi:hypothetical protein